MRIIEKEIIQKEIEEALSEIGYKLAPSYEEAIKRRIEETNDEFEKSILKDYIKNSEIALNKKVPLCQDTGVVDCFVEIGDQVYIDGNLNEIINQAVRNTYLKEQYRLSIVEDPFERKNTMDNTPAVINIDFVKGDKLKIMLMLKGGGSENVSLFKAMLPTDDEDSVVLEIKKHIEKIGAKACPPYCLGIAIGGNFEQVTKEAKKALLKDKTDKTDLEKKIIDEVNKLDIGPIGSGGITCVDVNVSLLSSHIASLFLGVAICCNAARKKVIEI